MRRSVLGLAGAAAALVGLAAPALAAGGGGLNGDALGRPLPRTGPRNRRYGPPTANVGRHHPDYGLSVAKHAARKATRSHTGVSKRRVY